MQIVNVLCLELAVSFFGTLFLCVQPKSIFVCVGLKKPFKEAGPIKTEGD